MRNINDLRRDLRAKTCSVIRFRDDEYVWFAHKAPRDNGESAFIQGDTPLRVRDLDKPVCGEYSPSFGELLVMDPFAELGTYYAVNPFKSDTSRTAENVSRFLYTMLEHDGISKEQQLAIYRNANLPIKALVDTGGKSLHAIVKIDARDHNEYEERRALLDERLHGLGFDKGKDAVRFTRLPGCRNGDARQQLVSTDCGAATFEEWEASVSIDDGLPEIQSFDDLENEEMEDPVELIKGVMHKGSKTTIGSNSKGRKTMLLIDLALSVASGTAWLDFETIKGRVLYINLELQKVFFRRRCRMIARAKGLSVEQFRENFDSLTLRGYAGDAVNLIPKFIQKIGAAQYDMIIIDPTYKLMIGKDENGTGEIGTLLNEFERLAVQTGAAVVCAAHFSKGNQAAKESVDRINGSGIWGRDPDTVITLTKHEEQDAMVVEFTLRNLPPLEPFTIQWNGNWLFERSGLDPNKVKTTQFKERYSDDDFLGQLSREDGEREWAKKVGCNLSTLQARIKKLGAAGKIHKSPLTQKWALTASEMLRRNARKE